VVWTQGFGVEDTTTQTPVTPDSIFPVASISKAFTAWEAMRLVEGWQTRSGYPHRTIPDPLETAGRRF
jgi:hypothetical protein